MARDSVDRATSEDDRGDPVCVSEIPHKFYQHLIGFLKTGNSMLFLETTEVWLDSYQVCIYRYLRGWLILHSHLLCQGVKTRGGCQVPFFCTEEYNSVDMTCPCTKTQHLQIKLNMRTVLSQRPRSHPHPAPGIFIAEIKSRIYSFSGEL